LVENHQIWGSGDLADFTALLIAHINPDFGTAIVKLGKASICLKTRNFDVPAMLPSQPIASAQRDYTR
jgi:hypothetical protein